MSLFKRAINSKFSMQNPTQMLHRSYPKASVPIPSKIGVTQSILSSPKILATLKTIKYSKVVTNFETITASMNSPVSDHSDAFSLGKSQSISASTSICSSPKISAKKSIEELFNFDGNQRDVLKSLKTKLLRINQLAIHIYQSILLFLGAKSLEPKPIYTPVLTPILDPITEIHALTKKENDSASGFNFLTLLEDGQHTIKNTLPGSATKTNHFPNNPVSGFKFLILIDDSSSSTPNVKDYNMDYIWLRLYQILLSDDPIEIQKIKLFQLSEIQLGDKNQVKVAKVDNNEELELPFLIYLLFYIYGLYIQAKIDSFAHKKSPKAPRRAKSTPRFNLKAQCKQNFRKIKTYNIIQPT